MDEERKYVAGKVSCICWGDRRFRPLTLTEAKAEVIDMAKDGLDGAEIYELVPAKLGLKKRIEVAIKLLELPELMSHEEDIYTKCLRSTVKDALRCLKGKMVKRED